MKAQRVLVALTLAGLAALLAARPASAQSPQKKAELAAQALFDEALKMMESGNAAAACPKFEESQVLDPGMGTQFRLAECYEKTGRLLDARAQYVEVADAAKAAKAAPREQAARKRVQALDARLGKLTIGVSPELAALPGAAVSLDGAPLPAASFGVESVLVAGDHEIGARAPGYAAWSKKLALAGGTTQTLSVPMLARETGEIAASPPVAPVPPPWPKQRIAAVIVGGLGLAGVVVGAVFGAKASSNWSDAVSHCRNAQTNLCDPDGVSLGSDARGAATVSTIGFVGGGVALAGAAVLWFTSRPAAAPAGSKEAFSLAPVVGPQGASAVIRGSF